MLGNMDLGGCRDCLFLRDSILVTDLCGDKRLNRIVRHNFRCDNANQITHRQLPVGYLIGVIASEVVTDDAIEAFIAAQISDEDAVSEEETISASPEVHIAQHDRASAPRIAPALRRKLERAGIDPEQIEGSGPEGRITKEDVDRAIG